MELVDERQLGTQPYVYYRSRALGITPYERGNKIKRNQYTLADAELIKNYSLVLHHSARHYKSLQYILSNRHRKLYEVAYELEISEYKARNLLDEYNRSGCIIVKSKL